LKGRNKIILLVTGLGIFTVYLIVGLLLEVKSKGNLFLSMFNYVVDCCVIFFNKFFGFLILEKVALAYSGLAFFAIGLVDGIYNLVSGIKKTKDIKSWAQGTRIIYHGVPVRIIHDDELSIAFTAGFFKPEIFISSGLWGSLNEDEKKSVLFHELSHAKARDPLRVIFLKFLSDTFFFIPIFKWLKIKFEELMEKSADDAVKTAGVEPLNLASALIKVSKNQGVLLPVASFVNIDTKLLLNSRIVRLLDPSRDSKFKIPKKVLTITAMIYIILILSAFVIPQNMVKKNSAGCNGAGINSSCSRNMSIEECRRHCLEHGMVAK